MSSQTLLLRVRAALERAERYWVAEDVVANARAAVEELIAAHITMPTIVDFIGECWQTIEEFLNTRNVSLPIVLIVGIEERSLTAAWSAFEELEIGILEHGLRLEVPPH